HFAKGNCNRGMSCHFLHKQEDTSSQSINNGSDMQYNYRNRKSLLHKSKTNSNYHQNKSAPSKNDLKDQKEQNAKIVDEEKYICGICFISSKEFGLLKQCDH
ncbi:877_t:CDS:2, partial [Funneliformis mosseae]